MKVSDIDHGRFTLLGDRDVKAGSQGSVSMYMDSKNDREVAIKEIIKSEDDAVIEVHAVREIASYKRLQRHDNAHENILELLDVYDYSTMFIVLTAMTTSLKTIIRTHCRSKTHMPCDVNLSYKKQIANGISWCHSKGIMHRDIKPDNILISDRCLKIGDFGLGKIYGCGKKHSVCAVTLWYRALEILLGDEFYDETIDIWSMACTFQEMDDCKPFFAGDSSVQQIMIIYKKLGNATEENFPGVRKLQYFNPDIKFNSKTMQLQPLYDKMLSFDRTKRPSATEVLKQLHE